MLATGDMGIGNTTPSAAIAAVINEIIRSKKSPGAAPVWTTRGLQRKICGDQQARSRSISPDPQDGLDVLAKVGGFEIGGLAGAILAAAANRRPVVIDGFISTAAAMIAVSLAPETRDYLIAAHTSLERGPPPDDGMAGNPIRCSICRCGWEKAPARCWRCRWSRLPVRFCDEMATFGEAGVSEKSA